MTAHLDVHQATYTWKTYARFGWDLGISWNDKSLDISGGKSEDMPTRIYFKQIKSLNLTRSSLGVILIIFVETDELRSIKFRFVSSNEKCLDATMEKLESLVELCERGERDDVTQERFINRRLENTGNSCYLNSTIQALAACYRFSTRCSQVGRLLRTDASVFSEERGDPTTRRQYEVLKSLTSLISHLLGENETSLPTSNLVAFRRDMGRIRKEFDDGSQQDAHEFLLILLAEVDELFAAKNRDDDAQYVSFLNPADVFKFSVETTLVCSGCNRRESRMEMENEIRLVVGDNNDSIQEMLNSVFQWESFKRECVECGSDAAQVSKRISTFPQSLKIMLKRYEIQGGRYVKLRHGVEPSFLIDASALGLDAILDRLHISCDKRDLSHHLRSLAREEDDEGRSAKRTTPPKEVIRIEPDGNCFFRAVSWCLTGSQNHHPVLRQHTVKYLEENETAMRKYCDDNEYGRHLENMKADGHWATSCEIFAMAELLQVPIYTYLADGGWIRHSPINGCLAAGSIFLKNVGHHFEPTVSLDADTEMETDAPIVSPPVLEMKEQQKASSEHADPQFYSLVAVICHIGDSPNSGHYVAYVRDSNELAKWICCNDNSVHVVTKETVISAIRESGYIMFYDM